MSAEDETRHDTDPADVRPLLDMFRAFQTELNRQERVGPSPRFDEHRSYPHSFPSMMEQLEAESIWMTSPFDESHQAPMVVHPDPQAGLKESMEKMLSEMKKHAWELTEVGSNTTQRTDLERQCWTSAFGALNLRDCIIRAQNSYEGTMTASDVSFDLSTTQDSLPTIRFATWLDHLVDLIRSTSYGVLERDLRTEMRRFFDFVKTISQETNASKRPEQPSRHVVSRSTLADELNQSFDAFTSQVRPTSMYPERLERREVARPIPDNDHDDRDASSSMVTVPGRMRGIPEVEEYIKLIRDLKANKSTARSRQEVNETNELIELYREKLRSLIRKLEQIFDGSR